MARRPDPYQGRTPTEAECRKRLAEVLAVGYRRQAERLALEAQERKKAEAAG